MGGLTSFNSEVQGMKNLDVPNTHPAMGEMMPSVPEAVSKLKRRPLEGDSSDVATEGVERRHIETSANRYRAIIKGVEKDIRDLQVYITNNLPKDQCGDYGEVVANAVLAIRKLEDARMRLGKVIQYLGDGVSCYDK